MAAMLSEDWSGSMRACGSWSMGRLRAQSMPAIDTSSKASLTLADIAVSVMRCN